MKELLDKIIWLVEYNEVISHRQLELNLRGEFISIPINTIPEAISTATQDGLVKRFEYRVDESLTPKYFYLPALSRLQG